MIFVDSSYFIAIFDKRDQWHDKAAKITIREDVVVSDLVISEVLTEVGRRAGGKVSHSVFNYFLDNCRIVYLDEGLLLAAEKDFVKYDGTLSLADAASLVIMQRMNISRIVSFDSDFDKAAKVKRIAG